MASPPTRALVTVSHASLTDPSADLSAAIEAAFGPEGLGIIVVDGVPGYGEARAALLPLASRLASLPADVLAGMEDPLSHWNFGWSHGKEKLEGDRVGARAPSNSVLLTHFRRLSRECCGCTCCLPSRWLTRATRCHATAQTPRRGRSTPTR
jgi:hypothetical protein